MLPCSNNDTPDESATSLLEESEGDGGYPIDEDGCPLCGSPHYDNHFPRHALAEMTGDDLRQSLLDRHPDDKELREALRRWSNCIDRLSRWLHEEDGSDDSEPDPE